MVKQLNVFSENRPGKLEKITGGGSGGWRSEQIWEFASHAEHPEERRYKCGGLLWVCGGKREEGDNSHGGSRFHGCWENT